MAQVKIPNDKDEIIALGEIFLKNQKGAVKQTGVRVPPAIVKQIHTGVTAARKRLAVARSLRKRAEAEQKAADRGVEQAEKGLRNAAQVLKRLTTDAKVLGLFGFVVDEARATVPTVQ
jgi:hypothetical protein